MEFADLNPWAGLGLRAVAIAVATFAFYSVGSVWINKQIMTGHSSLYAFVAGAILLGSVWTSVEIKSKGFTARFSELEQLQRKVHADLKILATQMSALTRGDYNKYGLAGLRGTDIYAIGFGDNYRFFRDVFDPKFLAGYEPIDPRADIVGPFLVKNVGVKDIKLGFVATDTMPLNTPINLKLLEDIRKLYGVKITVEDVIGTPPDKKPAQ